MKLIYAKVKSHNKLQIYIRHQINRKKGVKTLKNSPSYLSFLVIFFTFLIVPLETSCASVVTKIPVQTEEQALQSLRQMTKDGKLPPEDYLRLIEERYAGTK